MTMTAIFTTQKTTLTIVTMEEALLEEAGKPSRTLNKGPNEVSVGPGLSRVVSTLAVGVTAPSRDLHIVALDDKQGGPIELAKLAPSGFPVTGLDTLTDLKSHPLR